MLGKGERRVAAALEAIRVGLPFHLAGIHSDNGSEFINHHLARWCADRQVTFSRGRAGRSNDNPHVEQKNWALARQSVGYFRYDTPTELRLLNDLWAAQDVLFNLFNAQQKLTSKTRHGARVTKTYDTARTPADRLLTDHPDLVTDPDRNLITQASGRHEPGRATPADRSQPGQPHRAGPTPRNRGPTHPPPSRLRGSNQDQPTPIQAGIFR